MVILFWEMREDKVKKWIIYIGKDRFWRLEFVFIWVKDYIIWGYI